MFSKIMATYLFITFLSFINLVYGRSLRVDPSFLFIDEDWPINKPLAVSICGENIDKIKIISGNDDKRFTLHKINQTCANLQSNKEFDADQLHSDGTRWQSFSLLFEGGKKRRKASLDIQIVDINDNVPKFVNWRSEANVSEKQSVGSVVQRIQTFDPDTGVGGIVRFFVHGEKFSIENERCSNSYCHADLVLKSPLDYESNPIERVSIVARDGASLTKHANEAVANITINVVDEQDTPPTFLTTLTEPIRVLESVPIGTKIIQVNAVDGDRFAPRKNEILYEIVGKNDYFQINSVDGAITLKKQLDRENDSKIALTVVAVEQDDARMNSEMTFEIIVEDSDDNAPQCSSQQYTANLNRTSRKFEMDKTITVLDKDQGKNAQFNIELAGEFSESFDIKPKKAQGNAEITVEVVDYVSLEYVTDSKIVLEIKLDPRGTKPSTPSICLLVVHLDKLLPKKAVPPFKFLKNVFNVQVMENLSPPQIVANLTNSNVHDIEFMIEGNGTELFSINNQSQFMTTEILDAEKARNYKIKVYANSKDYTVTADVNIDVLDENDNAPQFEKHHYIFNVTEEQEAAFYVQANDLDEDANSEIKYILMEPIPENVTLNEKTGRISVKKIDVDSIGKSEINFIVMAEDNGEPPLNSTAKVTLQLMDINDNVPFFSKRAYSIIVDCNTSISSVVGNIKAIDMDATGSKIQYELPGEMQQFFNINSTTGAITLIQTLPETRKEFHFNVIARDSGIPPKQAVTRVTVRTSADCEEESESMVMIPTITMQQRTTANSTIIPSTPKTLAQILTTLLSVTPSIPTTTESFDSLSSQNKTFNKLESTTRVFVPRTIFAEVIENSPTGTKIADLAFDNSTLESNYDFHFATKNAEHAKLIKMNNRGELRVAENIDYEKVTVINGSVFARSDRRNLLFATVTIDVIDTNDNAPKFIISKDFTFLLPQNTEIGYVLDLPYPLAKDQDGSKEFSTLEYDLFENVTKSNCFKIDKASSLIQLIRPLSTCTSNKIFKLVIRAEDNVNKDSKERNSANTTITVEITADATTQIPKQSFNLSSEVFQNIPSEISVFEDETVGSVLLVLCKDDLIKNILQTNSSFNSTLISVELSVRNSDLIELFKESEIRLSKSLKGYINQKLCAQIEANVIINSMEPQLISKNLCLKIEARPKSPIIHFPAQNSVHKFKENTPYDSLLIFNVTSPILDPKLNGLKYGLIETNYDDGQQFSIDSRGVLKAAHPFDFEKREKYNIQTQICDFNDSCTVVAFRIQVEDLNDHCPTFTQRIETFNITENHPVGQDGIEIGNFTAAEDADGTAEKRSICYRLENENDALFFIPDNRKPALFIRKSLDREEQDIHNVTIIAQDCHFKERDLTCSEQSNNNNKTEESNKKLLVINVLDVNDNFPQFSQKEYYGKVIERKTKFGAKILQVEARDPDLESKGLHYSMSSAVRTESDVIPREEAPFHIDSTTGDIISHVVYSSKMPHSYNFRVIVRDEADHEDEASVTISVINYNEQLELIFDFPEEITRQNQREISKLMFDVTSMYFVIDDINGHGNSTNLLAHFLEKDKLLASASKALTIFEETKSEQAQRARHELRRTHGLKKIFSDSANPDIMDGFFSGAFVDVYTLVIGAVCASLFVIIILPTIYICCRRQNKASAKLNGNNPNHDVIYSNGIIADSIPSSSNNVALSKNSEILVNGLTLPSQRTSTLNTQQRPAPQMNSHQQQTPSRNESMITKPPEVHIFDALQSTEL